MKELKPFAVTVLAVFASGFILRWMSQGKLGPQAAHVASEVTQGFGGPVIA